MVFAVGAGLAFSAINIYVRDTRYVVESLNLILLWVVPVFYSFSKVPNRFKAIYDFNPVSAVVMAFRNILIEDKSPAASLLLKLLLVSTLALFVGALIFERLKKRFYDYL